MALTNAFSPLRLRALTLRNRVIKAATFEGMCPGGLPTSALIEHHRRVARGGAAMTTVAMGAVAADGRSYPTQLVMSREAIAGLREVTAAVHHERGAASIQLVHAGGCTHNSVIGTDPLGPSRVYNRYCKSYARPMTETEISRIVGDFARAARLAVDAGFDAVELHFGHGYLVSQFLSPYTNRRDDRWGGSLDNRARLAIEIVRVVRSVVGAGVPVLVKLNLDDGFPGGLQLDEGLAVAKRLEAEGVDALVPTCGFASKSPLYALRGDVPVLRFAAAQKSIFRRVGMLMFARLFMTEYPFQELFLLDEARALRKQVKLPLVLVGGIKSRKNIDIALREGFELVGMARALIHDPDLVNRLSSGSTETSSCVPCNECFGVIEGRDLACTKRASAS